VPPGNRVAPSQSRRSQAIFPTDAIMSQFEHKLFRYLNATGHPVHDLISKDFVGDEERRRDSESDTIRARKFLRFATGSELMPHGRWKLRVRLIFHDLGCYFNFILKIMFIHDFLANQQSFIPEHAIEGWNVRTTSFTSNTLIDLNCNLA
jgi:hypothetical protein